MASTMGRYKHGIKVTSGRPPGAKMFVPNLGVRVSVASAAKGLETIGLNAYTYALDATAANPGLRDIVERQVGPEEFVNAQHVLVNNGYDAEVVVEYFLYEVITDRITSGIEDFFRHIAEDLLLANTDGRHGA